MHQYDRQGAKARRVRTLQIVSGGLLVERQVDCIGGVLFER
jgi:hypothetical protein